MTALQFSIIVLLILVGIAVIPWSVERAVDKRWGEIRSMFDRALMHGDSLDTLKARMKADSEESKAKAAEALRLAKGAVDAVDILHREMKRIKEHPLIRPLGGNGPTETP
jgi:hypothetical protein